MFIVFYYHGALIAFSLLELHSLKVDDRARRLVLSDISFIFSAAERPAVLGPNGCGKSTLLKTLVWEQRIISGEIRLAGKLLSAISRYQRHCTLFIFSSTIRRSGVTP